MTRFSELLNSVKNYLTNNSQCCDKSTASYNYQCRKCGLVLEFNRNQPNVKCPNDGSTMYRI